MHSRVQKGWRIRRPLFINFNYETAIHSIHLFVENHYSVSPYLEKNKRTKIGIHLLNDVQSTERLTK